MTRLRLFLLGALLALAGGVLLWQALKPTPTVQADLNALPGLALYFAGFLVQFWAVFAPTPTSSQEGT